MAPPAKKVRTVAPGDGEGAWWACDACLKGTAFCAGHAGALLGKQAGKQALQQQLRTARTHLKKAQDNVARLEAAIKGEGGGGGSVPVLLLKHSGWDYDGDGETIRRGTAPVALALQSALAPKAREQLCQVLQGKSLSLTSCEDRRLHVSVHLPGDVLTCMPDVAEGRKEMRPGAVMYDMIKGKLVLYLRKSTSGKERASCKLFGYLLKEGLKSLHYRHEGGCIVCRKGHWVELELKSVKFRGSGDDASGDDENDDDEEEDEDEY